MNVRLLIVLLLLAPGILLCSGGQVESQSPENAQEASSEAAAETGEEAQEAAVATAEEKEEGGEAEEKKKDEDEAPTTAPGVVVNNVNYIVGDIPITSLDIEAMKAELKKMKSNSRRLGGRGRRKPRADVLEKQAVDTLIARAILEREAQVESIIISEARIEHEVEKRREVSGIRNEEKFQQAVEKQSGMPFDVWKKNLRYQLIRRQLIQIKLAIPAPSETEVRAFYRKNRKKLGLEIRFREIILQPRNRSLDEERRIASLARDIHREVVSAPRSFGRVARKLPSNVSRRRFAGGLYDYMPVQEVADRDRLMAGVLYSLRPGQVSQVFRNPRNQYIIVKLEGKRAVPLEKVENGIRQRLYVEKEQEVFDKWIEERRKSISIQKIQ